MLEPFVIFLDERLRKSGLTNAFHASHDSKTKKANNEMVFRVINLIPMFVIQQNLWF